MIITLYSTIFKNHRENELYEQDVCGIPTYRKMLNKLTAWKLCRIKPVGRPRQ